MDIKSTTIEESLSLDFLFSCRCIFIWRLPINLTEQAQARLLELKEKSHLANRDLPDG